MPQTNTQSGEDDPRHPRAEHLAAGISSSDDRNVVLKQLVGFDASANRHTSRGCQKRSSNASAAIEATPPATSVSDGPKKLEITNCTTANVPPQTSTAGQTPRRPRQPAIVTTIQAGTINEKKRKLPSGHGGELHFRQPGDFGERDDRRAERAERDGCCVGNQGESRGVERRETGADQKCGGNGDGRAESGGPFDERTEAERDQQRLNALIGRERDDGRFDDFEIARIDREHVQEDRGKHDPADGKHAEARTIAGGRERRLPRHAKDADRDRERRGKSGRGRFGRGPTGETQRAEQHHDGRRGEQRRDECGAGRIINLGPHQLLLASRCGRCVRIRAPRPHDRRLMES